AAMSDSLDSRETARRGPLGIDETSLGECVGSGNSVSLFNTGSGVIVGESFLGVAGSFQRAMGRRPVLSPVRNTGVMTCPRSAASPKLFKVSATCGILASTVRRASVKSHHDRRVTPSIRSPASSVATKPPSSRNAIALIDEETDGTNSPDHELLGL